MFICLFNAVKSGDVDRLKEMKTCQRVMAIGADNVIK
jgi:hypothetical protein